MKRLLMLISLVFLCCLGCQQGEEVVSTNIGENIRISPDGTEIYFDNVEADIQAIKEIIDDYEAAVNNSDVDRIMQPYADNAIEIRPNEPVCAGKEAIRNRKKLLFEDIAYIDEHYVVKNVEISGNLAVAHVTWSANVTLKEDGESVNPEGNWIWVFKRQQNVSWELIYSIWSNEDLIFPTQAK